MKRIDRLISILTTRNYFYVFLVGSITYLGLYYFALKYVALIDLVKFFDIYTPGYAYTAFSLTIIISILMGLNFSLLANRLKTIKIAKHDSVLGAGIFVSILATGCPSCAVGAFPAVMALFGVSLSLGSLPFGGVEVQLISMTFLVVSLYYLTSKKMCKVKGKK